MTSTRQPSGRYSIVRLYKDDASNPPRTLKTGLTLAEAKAHCKDPETSSSKCKSAAAIAHTDKYGAWFDSFDEEYQTVYTIVRR